MTGRRAVEPDPIDWSDVCDGADPYYAPDPVDYDLRGQGLTAVRIARMTDVEIAGEWL
ncbi:hypothetical protein [Streptomyces sp. NPDC058291]|uniref:hypothetical protein n=1 Tax=Streptomyces sp. NPDC058291 TaxID=3346427 RepID=UPI0036E98580